jgi:myosin heavy subunit
VFGTAADAYRGLLNDGESQAIVIGGESGAGKTEATKLILQYLSEVSI